MAAPTFQGQGPGHGEVAGHGELTRVDEPLFVLPPLLAPRPSPLPASLCLPALAGVCVGPSPPCQSCLDARSLSVSLSVPVSVSSWLLLLSPVNRSFRKPSPWVPVGSAPG